VWLLFGTLKAIERQAGLMERQANEMQLQREQSDAAMQRQLHHIGEQTGLLGSSVAVARETAEATRVAAKAAAVTAFAAEESAKAANAQIQTVKDKERARIGIKPVVLKVITFDWLTFDDVSIEIENFGYTNALNVTATGKGEMTESVAAPAFPDLDDLGIPNVVKASAEPIRLSMWFNADDRYKDVSRSKPNLFIHIKGKVNYEDVFGGAHYTAFRYVLQIDSLGPNDPETRAAKITSYGGWRLMFVIPEDNHAT
jgi:hypothetical protein